MTTDLQFDKMEVDTTLAREYIRANNSEFHSTNYKENGDYMFDTAKNKIYCSNSDQVLKYRSGPLKQNIVLNLLKLASDVLKHKELFCQLEWLIRKKPIEVTQMDIDMVVKSLRCQASSSVYNEDNLICCQIVMRNNTPLIDLSNFATVEGGRCVMTIVATENTAVVCHLFTELCHANEFIDCKLAFVTPNEYDDATKIDYQIKKSKVLSGGCVAVVAEQSDVDSAVDRLLASPKEGFWGLRRILVQESALGRFTQALRWKARGGAPADSELRALSSDCFEHDGKLFLHEYVGGETSLGIPVEAFRTAKEAIALVASCGPFCVSLWAGDGGASTEMALAFGAPLVWVNDHCALAETNQVALAYRSNVLWPNYACRVEDDVVLKLQAAWAALTTDERRAKMAAAHAFDGDLERVLYAEPASDDFVVVHRDSVVMGLTTPRPSYFVRCEDSDVAEILRYLVGGSGFVVEIDKDKYPAAASILLDLQRAALPIRVVPGYIKAASYRLKHNTRIIHSSYGTIFAN